MKRILMIPLLAITAGLIGLAPAAAQPQPMPTPAEARFAKLEEKHAATGAGKHYKIKRNRVFDAIANQEHARHVFNAQLGLDAAKNDHSFRHAAQNFMGTKVPKDLPQRIAKSHALHAAHLQSLPRATQASYDCRALGLVPPIKNQGGCGDCYNFSAVGVVESANILAKNGTAATVNYSEQRQLDCEDVGGCDGGWPEDVVKVAQTTGLANTSDYGPYRAQAGNCKKVATPNKVATYGYVGSSDAVPPVQAIKDAMVAHGPISVAIAADSAFAAYSNGVFVDSGSRDIDHAVILVGWQDDASVPGGGYWILRNSWDTSWGENGYIRISYTANMVGYGALWCSATSVNPSPTPPTPPGPTPPVPPNPTPVVSPTYSVTVTGQIPSGSIFGGTKTVTLSGTATPQAQKVSKPLTAAQKEQRLKDCNTARAVRDGLGLSFSTVIDVLNLITLIRAEGNGQLLADLKALEGAIANRAGIVAAAEKLITDAVAVSADPAVIAALGKVLADLGISIP